MKYLFLRVIALGLLIGFNSQAADVADFDDSSEIKPFTKELSDAEKNKDSNLEDIDYGQKLPELLCADENLKKQISNFIYSFSAFEEIGSVIEQRRQHLLVRNIHDFAEVTADSLNSKDNYLAASIIAFLKINQNKDIYKICRSKGNDSKKFADLFAIIYRDGAYYQIIVPNMIYSTKDIDKATFTYGW